MPAATHRKTGRDGGQRERIPLAIIIPAYDRQAEVDRALKSILAQDVLPEAVIVVDDASTVPVTVDEATRAALNLSLLRHQANRGPAASRNTGMNAAASEWIGFLDSDDALRPGTLGKRWRSVADEQDGTGDAARTIYACGWEECASDGAPIGVRMPRSASEPADFASGCWFSPGSCIILNRSAALDVGIQDEGLRRLEDLDWFLALALAGFRLSVLPLIGVTLERKRVQDPARIRDAASLLRTKWTGAGLSPAFLRRLNAYLDLEIAAAEYFTGARLRAACYLARSFVRRPRLGLHLSPGFASSKIRRIEAPADPSGGDFDKERN